MGDIGKEHTKRVLEPMPETMPIQEPSPEPAPVEEPVPA
jgi:hypothetical protein